MKRSEVKWTGAELMVWSLRWWVEGKEGNTVWGEGSVRVVKE